MQDSESLEKDEGADDARSYMENAAFLPSNERGRHIPRPQTAAWPWIIHTILLLLNVVLFLLLFKRHLIGSLRIWDPENIYDELPSEYVKVAFNRSGFHGGDSDPSPRTPYEGRPNVENNAQWDRLMSAGMIELNEREFERLLRLPQQTVPIHNHPEKFLVELEMFHQLHCLKKLREQLWKWDPENPDREKESEKRNESPTEMHFDHCVDYLRQVIMCHGDLTPATFGWSEQYQTYLAKHEILHRCRNFERIFEFAKYKAANISIDGDHKNLDDIHKK